MIVYDKIYNRKYAKYKKNKDYLDELLIGCIVGSATLYAAESPCSP